MATASRQEALASLEAKIHAYCEVASATRTLHGLPEYATQLQKEGDLSTLRALANEIDTWLREDHSVEEQSAISTRMLVRGVLSAHLPKSIDRAVRRILNRGSITSTAEAVLVKGIAFNPSLRAKYAAELQQLCLLAAPWNTKS